ncbi:DAZ-associated protein 2 isoform X2 [Trichechus manatus latirostris]|uniref:DAZ-associated protein 2 n=1 Tax=Trichechus manatus latirostris TaxID=127582 RepID=A0A2Y9E8B6_TRIMA|nr:DAZ-associated protein 2 isoform X2 [Trichechus manatus latirostris]
MNSKGQYPTQPTYPVQPPGNPVYPQTLHLPQAPPYTDAPPAYSELYRPSFVHPGAATVPTMSAAFPGASLYLPMAQSVAVGPLGSTIPMAYYPVGPIYPPASTPWLPSQCCSARSHAGSQRPRNSAEGKLLHGWLRWWLHHLVRSQGHLCAGKDITYLQHFSQCNCFSHINLKLQFRHMLLGCLSGAQTFRHFSNLIRTHVMVAVPS